MADMIRTFTDDKIWLWGWDWEYLGALFEVDVYFYPTESKFCGEGVLTYANIVKIGQGEVCAQRNGDGEFTIWGDAEIKIADKPVARGKFNIRIYWDRTNGIAYLRKVRLDICGTNTFQLRCKDWEKEYSFTGEQQLYVPSIDARILDERQLLMSMLTPRTRIRITEGSSSNTEDQAASAQKNGGIVDNG